MSNFTALVRADDDVYLRWLRTRRLANSAAIGLAVVQRRA
jgi:hypothetical protein